MFNNHTMTVVTNLNMIGDTINNADFVTIAAITSSDYPTHPNIYNASILMPPTDILMAWANNQPLVMQNAYPKYLMTKDPDDMLVALIAAMTKKNIIFYIPQDEFNIYGMILLNHIYYMYGITCNYMNTTFSVDPFKIPYIMSKFYMIDVMDMDEYLSAYPANAALPAFVIGKMAQETNVFNRPATFQEYSEYFNNLNASKKADTKPIEILTNR